MAALAVLTFSPDGSTLVFPGRENGRQYLFRRYLPDREAHAIPGTDDGEAPFFSPDGRWIGFRARRQLDAGRLKVEGQQVPVLDGVAQALNSGNTNNIAFEPADERGNEQVQRNHARRV